MMALDMLQRWSGEGQQRLFLDLAAAGVWTSKGIPLLSANSRHSPLTRSPRQIREKIVRDFRKDIASTRWRMMR